MGYEQTADLGYAQSASVEDFQDGPVAEALPAFQRHAVHDGGYFLHRQHFRQIAAEFGPVHQLAGIVGTETLQNHPAEERRQAGKDAGLTAFGEHFRAGLKIGLDVGGGTVGQAGLRGGSDEPVQEIGHIAYVTRDGIGRVVPLHSKVVGIFLYGFGRVHTLQRYKINCYICRL